MVGEWVGNGVGHWYGERRWLGAVLWLVEQWLGLLVGLSEVELVPVAGHCIQYFRIHATTFSGSFNSKTGPLEHRIALFLALQYGALYLVVVERMRVRQH